jgi:pimeloyl-ACP methyl ester carboxylesterase
MVDVVARDVRFHVQRISPPPDSPADRPVVVFLHGLILDNLSSFYYTLAGPVAGTGADTIMYDLRGHGRSQRPPDGYTVDDAVDDLAALLTALGVARPVVLVGNSFGGVVALRFALRRPQDVAGLVVIEAHTVGDGAGDWTEHMSNTLTVTALGLAHDGLADQLQKLGDRKLARAARLAGELLNGTTLIDDVAATPPLHGPELAAIGCPVLAVYGVHSDLAPAGRQLARHLPDCTLHMIPDQAHTVLREATPLVRALVLDWLTRRAVAS